MNHNQIHQTLHGYNIGHKLLVASTNLSSKSKDILLSNSDSPGQRFHEQNNICYTGYPLADEGYYVLSKTWAATEVERPGCVWTHSLLIPFGLLEDTRLSGTILDSFIDKVNPEVMDIISEPILYDFHSPNLEVRDLSCEASYIISSTKQVTINASTYNVQDIITIWNVLLAKARCFFSFRTWTPKTVPSDSEYNKFDLLLSEFCNSKIECSENWAKPYFSNAKPSLEHFQQKYGQHFDKEKLNTVYLTKSYLLLEERRLDELAMLILKWKKAPISLVKHVIKSISTMDLSLALAYLISSHVRVLKENDVSQTLLSKVGSVLYEHDKKFLIRILSEKTTHTKNISIKVINGLPIDLVLSGYRDGIYSGSDILQPNIIKNESFWDECGNDLRLLKRVISDKELIKSVPLSRITPDLARTDGAYKPYIYKVLMNDFENLNTEWKKYILENQCDFCSFVEELDYTPTTQIAIFILSNFDLAFLSQCSDLMLTNLYKSSTVNNHIIKQILLLIVSDRSSKFPELFKSAFDDICYYLSREEMDYQESKRIKSEIHMWFDYKSVFPISLRKSFFVFSVIYADRLQIPFEMLTKYSDNLYQLNKFSKKADDYCD